MSEDEIRKMFPLTINITEQNINEAISLGGKHKLGTLLLKQEFPKELHEDIFYGLSIGTIKGIKIKTEFKDKDGKYLPLYIDNNFNGEKIIFKLRN